MKQLIPYINFNGQCQEALEFYASCFNNAELSVRHFPDEPDLANSGKNNVMHGEFKADGLVFLASDGQAGDALLAGNNIYLNVQLDCIEEQSELFNRLSVQGKVVMPLQITSWGSRFGMLTDKFAIQWMLNVIEAKI